MVNLLKELRPATLRMHSFGYKQQEIADALHISQQLVSKAIIRGTIEDRPGRGRKRTARTRENILKIKRKIQRNSSSRKSSARKMAHAHRISPMSVHRILAEELKLKSWKPEATRFDKEKARLQKSPRAFAVKPIQKQPTSTLGVF